MAILFGIGLMMIALAVVIRTRHPLAWGNILATAQSVGAVSWQAVVDIYYGPIMRGAKLLQWLNASASLLAMVFAILLRSPVAHPVVDYTGVLQPLLTDGMVKTICGIAVVTGLLIVLAFQPSMTRGVATIPAGQSHVDVTFPKMSHMPKIDAQGFDPTAMFDIVQVTNFSFRIELPAAAVTDQVFTWSAVEQVGLAPVVRMLFVAMTGHFTIGAAFFTVALMAHSRICVILGFLFVVLAVEMFFICYDVVDGILTTAADLGEAPAESVASLIVGLILDDKAKIAQAMQFTVPSAQQTAGIVNQERIREKKWKRYRSVYSIIVPISTIALLMPWSVVLLFVGMSNVVTTAFSTMAEYGMHWIIERNIADDAHKAAIKKMESIQLRLKVQTLYNFMIVSTLLLLPFMISLIIPGASIVFAARILRAQRWILGFIEGSESLPLPGFFIAGLGLLMLAVAWFIPSRQDVSKISDPDEKKRAQESADRRIGIAAQIAMWGSIGLVAGAFGIYAHWAWNADRVSVNGLVTDKAAEEMTPPWVKFDKVLKTGPVGRGASLPQGMYGDDTDDGVLVGIPSWPHGAQAVTVLKRQGKDGPPVRLARMTEATQTFFDSRVESGLEYGYAFEAEYRECPAGTTCPPAAFGPVTTKSSMWVFIHIADKAAPGAVVIENPLRVRVAWHAVSGAKGYCVERRRRDDAGLPFTLIGFTDLSNHVVLDDGAVVRGGAYFYRVSTVKEGLNPWNCLASVRLARPSAAKLVEISATPPAPPVSSAKKPPPSGKGKRVAAGSGCPSCPASYTHLPESVWETCRNFPGACDGL